jgi:hypothetical protein
VVRPGILLGLVTVTLLGGGALAQPRLVVDPWRAPSAPGSAILPLGDLPASGLPEVGQGLPAPHQLELAVQPPPKRTKWLPPLVALLVDPWAELGTVAPQPKPRWARRVSEIIDPWADQATADPPPVAPGSAKTPRSTIF